MSEQHGTPNNSNSYSCVACQRPDSDDNLVACDKCSNWWHFSCAGVTDSVKLVKWMCRHCLPKPAKSVSVASSVSSRRARLELNMKRLEEQRALDKKQMELELEKKYLKEKYQLLEETLQEEVETRSVRYRVDEIESRAKQTSQWIEDQAAVESAGNKQDAPAVGVPNLEEGVSLDPPAPVFQIGTEEGAVGGIDGEIRDPQMPPENSAYRRLQQTLQNYEQDGQPTFQQLQQLQEQLQQCQLQLLHQSTPVSSRFPGVSRGAVPKSNRHQIATEDHMLRTAIPDSIPLEAPDRRAPHNQVLLQNLNQIGNIVPPRHGINGPIPMTSSSLVRQGPSPEQLAARQVMPRDLPEFTGDPEEWPMFLSSYNNTTNACGYNNAENLSRLQRCLKGSALKSVRYYLMSPESVPDVIRTLETLYGRPEMIINKLIKNVRETPPPKSEKLETLIEFGMAIRNLTQHLIVAGQQSHLANPILLQEIVDKLPAGVKLQWAQHLQHHPVASLQIFSQFMTTVVEAVSKVVVYVGEPMSKSEKPRSREKGFLHAHAEVRGTGETRYVPKRCPVCAKDDHRVADCATFKGSSVENRWKSVTSLKLCRCCLNFHGRRACRNTSRCGVNGCEFRHHPMLHTSLPRQGNTSNNRCTNTSIENHSHHHCGQSVLFRIIPVILHGPTKSIKVFAFLDEGSSATLIEHELAEQLGAQGQTSPMCLTWTANMSRLESKSQVVSLDVSGIGQQNRYHLSNIRTVEALNLPRQTLRFEQLQRHFCHLAGLAVESYEHADPRLLLGLHNLRFAVPLETREGDYGPIATKTRLGWCVYGSVDSQHGPEHVSLHICECNKNENLETMMREYFNADYMGVAPSEPLMSEENKRAQRILESTTTRIGNRFQTGLIWRYDEIYLPDSFPMAVQRLKCLERRMQKDAVLRDNLHRQIREYQEKGYAHQLTNEEQLTVDAKRVWYLPISAVTNPNKPGKVRLVWDAAAQVAGISLNSLLLPGPDLLTPLPHVLFRFRQYPVAVSGDIKEMYHQIGIIQADRHSQRFLWRDNPDQSPQIFAMDVAIFGATCSPSSAQYVKNLNAKEFASQYPEAVNDIVKCHYVDDYLGSYETVEDAKRIAEDVKVVHSKGGFEIRDWASNSEAVLEHLGGAKVKGVKELTSTGNASTERVLGMIWQSDTDELRFSATFRTEIAKLIDVEARPTKRQILKCIMTLFDPLGLLASFLVHGKIMMQDVWRAKIQWDERINDQIYERWKRWISLFHKIRELKIPRCYFQNSNTSTYSSTQLHIFVDASEDAYSAVAYFRVEIQKEIFQCALVAAKTKVAPIQHVTIPRLELMAAALGVRLANFVVAGHSISISKTIFWSDSRTVLAWISSEHRRYRQFVACRVGEILLSTNANDWRWVPSKLNVADEATKWGKGPCFDLFSRWYQGPEFLYHDEQSWPQPAEQNITTEEELRSCYIHQEGAIPLIRFDRFSNWNRLLRAVAYVRRFVNACRHRIQGNFSRRILTQPELLNAEVLLWRIVQKDQYAEEIAIIRKNEELPVKKRVPLEKNSVLHKLTPILDAQDVLRVEGRIGSLQIVSVDMKCPIILPRHHRVTYLLVDSYHRKYLHANSETIVNELRQRFYISRLRVLVKTITNRCQICKIKKARPFVPRMAPLPPARLSPFVRPFSYVGLDYFGPITVKVGRSTAKRWIALFTCLTVRAVHVEVAFDLSTHCCISSIRRFVARRGAPKEIYSDNGRNFVGAERILKQQIASIYENAAITFTNAHTKWVFIPPYAPNMGGSWERLVRSIKIAMTNLPQERKMDDDALHTAVVEAEAIVNTRPLTYLPLDSAEQEAITPNHFLLGSSTGVTQPTVDLADATKAVRGTWHLIQYNLDHFWRRWIREYLPTLTRRTKWFGDSRAVQKGDLVVVIDDTKRNGWIRGKVLEVIPGRDGRIRQAVVQTSTGAFRRPVSKLAILEVNQTDKDESNTHLYGEGTVGTGSPSYTTTVNVVEVNRICQPSNATRAPE
ncbi:uncharacterized protein LOC131680521 [Topomyia yanbarensis]|uniref:uncharacterized protein LOC131680521 n=1 Tax=Topomyia yanbarensis TaxID=2498891 RepID=UPI00273C9531|nr:uncharacterized protein LOC131680521 [Topomyia yanbarensis]